MPRSTFERKVLHSLLALLVIPTNSPSKWNTDPYSGSPSNQVRFSDKGIEVQVDKSSGPLYYLLDGTKKASGFHISGTFHGLPVLKDKSKQGEPHFDDYALRIGFVVPGSKTLSGIKRIFAPKWIRNLFDKVPSGSGIDHVQFYVVTQNPQQLGKSRPHPASDLLIEDFFALKEQPGDFDYNVQFAAPIDTSAIWISIDGNQTKSKFDVLIRDFVLNLH